jgi:hypothetical protein
MTFASFRQRLFDVAALLSLALCLISGGLWARSLGHFERVDLRYARWRQADDMHSYFAALSWYSNTLRLEVISVPFGPAFFQSQPAGNVQYFRNQHPPGVRWGFLGDNITAEMNGYPPSTRRMQRPALRETATRWQSAPGYRRCWLRSCHSPGSFTIAAARERCGGSDFARYSSPSRSSLFCSPLDCG